MLVNVVRQSVDKLFEVLDTIDITNQCVTSTKELGHGAAIINHWGITHDGVSCDGFIVAGNVEDRIMSLEVILK